MNYGSIGDSTTSLGNIIYDPSTAIPQEETDEDVNEIVVTGNKVDMNHVYNFVAQEFVSTNDFYSGGTYLAANLSSSLGLSQELKELLEFKVRTIEGKLGADQWTHYFRQQFGLTNDANALVRSHEDLSQEIQSVDFR